MPVGVEDGAPGEEPPPTGQHLPSQPGPRPILLPRLLDEVAPKITFLCPDAREMGCTEFRKGVREERGSRRPPGPADSFRAEEVKILPPGEECSQAPGPKRELRTPPPQARMQTFCPHKAWASVSPAAVPDNRSDVRGLLNGYTSHALSTPRRVTGVKGSVVMTRITTRTTLENVAVNESSWSQKTTSCV